MSSHRSPPLKGLPIDPAANLAFIEKAPDTMETSMQRDQAAGRPIELDALGGALLRRADKAGIQVPVTRSAWWKSSEARSRCSTSA